MTSIAGIEERNEEIDCSRSEQVSVPLWHCKICQYLLNSCKKICLVRAQKLTEISYFHKCEPWSGLATSSCLKNLSLNLVNAGMRQKRLEPTPALFKEAMGKKIVTSEEEQIVSADSAPIAGPRLDANVTWKCLRNSVRMHTQRECSGQRIETLPARKEGFVRKFRYHQHTVLSRIFQALGLILIASVWCWQDSCWTTGECAS